MTNALDVNIANSGPDQNVQPANTSESLNEASDGSNNNAQAEI